LTHTLLFLSLQIRHPHEKPKSGFASLFRGPARFEEISEMAQERYDKILVHLQAWAKSQGNTHPAYNEVYRKLLSNGVTFPAALAGEQLVSVEGELPPEGFATDPYRAPVASRPGVGTHAQHQQQQAGAGGAADPEGGPIALPIAVQVRAENARYSYAGASRHPMQPGVQPAPRHISQQQQQHNGSVRGAETHGYGNGSSGRGGTPKSIPQPRPASHALPPADDPLPPLGRFTYLPAAKVYDDAVGFRTVLCDTPPSMIPQGDFFAHDAKQLRGAVRDLEGGLGSESVLSNPSAMTQILRASKCALLIVEYYDVLARDVAAAVRAYGPGDGVLSRVVMVDTDSKPILGAPNPFVHAGDAAAAAAAAGAGAGARAGSGVAPGAPQVESDSSLSAPGGRPHSLSFGSGGLPGVDFPEEEYAARVRAARAAEDERAALQLALSDGGPIVRCKSVATLVAQELEMLVADGIADDASAEKVRQMRLLRDAEAEQKQQEQQRQKGAAAVGAQLDLFSATSQSSSLGSSAPAPAAAAAAADAAALAAAHDEWAGIATARGAGAGAPYAADDDGADAFASLAAESSAASPAYAFGAGASAAGSAPALLVDVFASPDPTPAHAHAAGAVSAPSAAPVAAPAGGLSVQLSPMHTVTVPADDLDALMMATQGARRISHYGPYGASATATPAHGSPYVAPAAAAAPAPMAPLAEPAELDIFAENIPPQPSSSLPSVGTAGAGRASQYSLQLPNGQSASTAAAAEEEDPFAMFAANALKAVSTPRVSVDAAAPPSAALAARPARVLRVEGSPDGVAAPPAPVSATGGPQRPDTTLSSDDEA
jgi:hypothetical protein